MESKRTREELIDILNRNTTWIENCDSKASIITSGIGVVIGILLATDYVAKFQEIYTYMVDQTGFWSMIYLILSGISIIGILIGCFSLIQVLIARIDPNEFSDKGIQLESLIYFSSIAKFKTLSAYRQKLEKCDLEKMNNDLISQIYICSLICDKKFRHYKLGLFISLAGFSLFITLAVIGLAISK
ncbi:MAG: DUF5706 domain-containing protein [Eubacteriales bacterium]|nr:DUF5706 domain-containing protein [Eubacteriales bacterium]